MSNLKGCFLHNSDEWQTLIDIYNWFVNECGYFDPCPINHTEDGLLIDWKKNVFCNPPYSQIDKWVDKAITEHLHQYDSHIVLLLPARTDTKWFRKLSCHCCHIQFITGRLHFNGSKGSAPFPSMLVSLYYGTGDGSPNFWCIDRNFYK